MANIIRGVPIVILALLTGCAGLATQPVVRSCFHADREFEVEVGYCQAVRSGNTLYISGTAASGDMAAATKSVYERLGETLRANGLSFADVVKENVYATDLDAFIKSQALRKAFYTQAQSPFPAATWVEVPRLYTPSLVLEVELVAEYPR